MIPAADETRYKKNLCQSRNVMFSVMTSSITVNQKVQLQLRFDEARRRIRHVHSSCVSSG